MLSVGSVGQNSYNTSFGCKNVKMVTTAINSVNKDRLIKEAVKSGKIDSVGINALKTTALISSLACLLGIKKASEKQSKSEIQKKSVEEINYLSLRSHDAKFLLHPKMCPELAGQTIVDKQELCNITSKYDDRGRLVLSRVDGKNGCVEEYYTYYDDENRIIKKCDFRGSDDKNLKLFNDKEYQYPNSGCIVELVKKRYVAPW